MDGRFLERLEYHQPQNDRGDDIADYNQSCDAALAEQRGNFLRGGRRFGRQLLASPHVWQTNESSEFLVMAFVEHRHIYKNEEH